MKTKKFLKLLALKKDALKKIKGERGEPDPTPISLPGVGDLGGNGHTYP